MFKPACTILIIASTECQERFGDFDQLHGQNTAKYTPSSFKLYIHDEGAGLRCGKALNRIHNTRPKPVPPSLDLIIGKQGTWPSTEPNIVAGQLLAGGRDIPHFFAFIYLILHY
jgi:hypothetical protein